MSEGTSWTLASLDRIDEGTTDTRSQQWSDASRTGTTFMSIVELRAWNRREIDYDFAVAADGITLRGDESSLVRGSVSYV